MPFLPWVRRRKRFDGLEDAYWDLLTLTDVYNAFGATLDQIGNLVGQPRNGLLDDAYQRYIVAKIAANKSDGLLEDLIGIAILIVHDSAAVIVADTRGTGSLSLRVSGVTSTDEIANILIDFLQAAASAGVRVVVENQYSVDSDTWMFAQAAFLNGASGIGASSLTVDSTAGFPASGSLDIDVGTSNQDLGVTYSGTTPTQFLNVVGLAHTHVDKTCAALAGSPGRGMGDTGDLAVGGELISARDAHYP